MNKEKWVAEIINTAKKTEPVKASPTIYVTIKDRLQETTAGQIVSLRWMYAAAAAIGLLLILNISTWKSIQKSSNEEPVFRSEFSLTGNNAYSLNY